MTKVVPWKLRGGLRRLDTLEIESGLPMEESGACHCCQGRNWAGKTVIVCFDSQSANVRRSSE